MSLWDRLPRSARVAVVVAAILYFGALPLAVIVRLWSG